MKIAIVHDYLNQVGGAERVVEVFHDIWSEAPIYTSIVDEDKLLNGLKKADIRVTWMQKLPGLKKHFKKYFLLYPFAMQGIDLTEYDLIISSSSAYAKGIKKRKDAVHICYCHTPMRFVWDYDSYVRRENMGKLTKLILPIFIKALKKWDIKTIDNVDYYIANSHEVKNRIKNFYNRDSRVIFPPVDTSKYNIIEKDEKYFLVVSRLVSYKRIDLAVKAFNKLGLPLVIIGSGPHKIHLEKMANKNIKFMGRLSDAEVAYYMATCRAFIFPGKEDFGITPLEVNSAGRPVIAYKAGGALDTVIDWKTGVFFDEQTEESLVRSVQKFDREFKLNKQKIREHACKFDNKVFINNIKEFTDKILNNK